MDTAPTSCSEATARSNARSAEASVSCGDRTIYRVSRDEGDEAVTVPFVEGWEPRPERQVTMEAEDPSDMFGMLSDTYVYFSPGLVFDVVPDGGVAYSDSSAPAGRRGQAQKGPCGTEGLILTRSAGVNRREFRPAIV